MPVWPSCFCTIWPIGAMATIRLPAPMMPMSFIVTPPSDQRALHGLGRQVDDVLVRVLAELGHVNAEDPQVL